MGDFTVGEIVYYVGWSPLMHGKQLRIVGPDKTLPQLLLVEPVGFELDYEWSVAPHQLSRVNPTVIKSGAK